MPAIDWTGFRFGKPEKRIKTQRRDARVESERTKKTRIYVFARERCICRCCRVRPTESMHELQFRSQGGKISPYNSIACCGDGVQGCHGYLQRHEIAVDVTLEGAEGRLIFAPKTERAAEWLRIALGAVIVSDPMVQVEQEV